MSKKHCHNNVFIQSQGDIFLSNALREYIDLLNGHPLLQELRNNKACPEMLGYCPLKNLNGKNVALEVLQYNIVRLDKALSDPTKWNKRQLEALNLMNNKVEELKIRDAVEHMLGVSAFSVDDSFEHRSEEHINKWQDFVQQQKKELNRAARFL